MAGIRVDRDPLARPGRAPAHEATGVKRGVEQPGGRQRVGDRARAVIALVEPLAVAAAPQVRRAGDRVAGLDDLAHGLRRLDRRQRDAVLQDVGLADGGVARRPGVALQRARVDVAEAAPVGAGVASAGSSTGSAADAAVSPATGATTFARRLRVGSSSVARGVSGVDAFAAARARWREPSRRRSERDHETCGGHDHEHRRHDDPSAHAAQYADATREMTQRLAAASPAGHASVHRRYR